VLSANITGAKMLFDDIGKPSNHALVEASIILTPKLISVTPNVGNTYG
jgi:hypothetical protein